MTPGKVVGVVALVLILGGIAWKVRAVSEEREGARRVMAAFDFTSARRRYSASVALNQVYEEAAAHTQKIDQNKRKEAYRKLREAEKAYVEACLVCASTAECEQDRERIESGRVIRADNYNPCGQYQFNSE